VFAYLNAPTLRFVFEGGPERVRAPFPASRQAKAESKFAKKLKGSPIFGMLARQGKVFSHQPICAYARTTMSFYFWADDLKPEAVARGWRPPRGAFPDAARPGAESTHAGAAKVDVSLQATQKKHKTKAQAPPVATPVKLRFADVATMSIQEMKLELAALGSSAAGCVERKDLVERLLGERRRYQQQHQNQQQKQPQPQPQQQQQQQQRLEQQRLEQQYQQRQRDEQLEALRRQVEEQRKTLEQQHAALRRYAQAELDRMDRDLPALKGGKEGVCEEKPGAPEMEVAESAPRTTEAGARALLSQQSRCAKSPLRAAARTAVSEKWTCGQCGFGHNNGFISACAECDAPRSLVASAAAVKNSASAPHARPGAAEKGGGGDGGEVPDVIICGESPARTMRQLNVRPGAGEPARAGGKLESASGACRPDKACTVHLADAAPVVPRVLSERSAEQPPVVATVASQQEPSEALKQQQLSHLAQAYQHEYNVLQHHVHQQLNHRALMGATPEEMQGLVLQAQQFLYAEQQRLHFALASHTQHVAVMHSL